MQVSIETTSNLGRSLTVVVPAESVKNAYENKIKQLMQTVRIAGFRPGKAPRKTVEDRFGVLKHQESVEEVLQKTLNQALTDENIVPAGRPVIQSLKAEKDQPLEYTVSFEIYPEVQLKGLNEIKIEKQIVDIEESDIDTVLEQMRKQHAKWEAVDHPAQKGNRLMVNLKWQDDKQELHEQKNVPILLEKGAIPVEFEALEGAKVGEVRQVKLPLQNPSSSAVDAEVTIVSVLGSKLPEVNDEFAKQLDVKGGVTELRSEIRQHMQRQMEESLQNRLTSQLIDQLLAKNNFEVPKALVEMEYQALTQEFLSRNKAKSDTPIPENIKPQMQESAQKRVRLSLIYSSVVKESSIKVDDAKVKAKVEQIAGIFETPTEMLEKIFSDKNLLRNIRSQVLEQQVVEKLLEQVQYSDKKVSYSELMKGQEHDHEHVHDENCQHDHEHA